MINPLNKNPKPKLSYKDIHGTTRVGDFLRSIGKSEVLTKILGSTAQAVTGDLKGAIETLLKSSDELTSEQREHALKLLESDLKENEEISNRWNYDMISDNKLSKNIRPLSLAYLTVVSTIIVVLDSSIQNFIVNTEWIYLLKTLLVTVYVAYFGGRSYEKIKKI